VEIWVACLANWTTRGEVIATAHSQIRPRISLGQRGEENWWNIFEEGDESKSIVSFMVPSFGLKCEEG
jgi:hypothetical protein